MPFTRTDEAYLRGKKNLPTDLTTRQMELLSAQIRERVFWSATVSNARVVQTMHAVSTALAGGKISASDARLTIAKMLEKQGYKPADGTEKSIRDLTTMRRQNLVLRTNLEMARGYAHHAEAQEDLDLYPCQELVRARHSKVPRDWHARWIAAGGKLFGGRMIAEINSPIWRKISRFGLPYPPFDFNSGMDIAPIRRDEAVRLGVIAQDSVQEPADELPSMNENLEAKFENASPELKAKISERLQGLAEWNGDTLVFTDPNGTKPYSAAEIVEVLKKPLPDGLYGKDTSSYHQRDAAIEWANNSDWIKEHPASDQAYHLGRLVNRIIPLDSNIHIWRGMSFGKDKKGQELYQKFKDEIKKGTYERDAFESYTLEKSVAEKFGEERVYKVIIEVTSHKSAKDFSEIIKAYRRIFADEKEVLFAGKGKMKIQNVEEKTDGIYLTVTEE